MIGLVVWQQLLDGLGWVLARIYDAVPNYGLAIIILTIAIRALLLPLGFKQIKSMGSMQALQPKLKEIQKKYKNNRQKQQEEQMKLYREAGVSPLGGCLPLLLTLPFLFAMYAVIRPASLVPQDVQDPAKGFVIANNHLPQDSALFQAVLTHQNTDFLFMDLQCSVVHAGTQVPNTWRYQGQSGQLPGPANPEPSLQTPAPILGKGGTPLPFDATTTAYLDCGTSRLPDIIPYVLVLVVMVGLTFFQTFQIQRASPQGAQSSQQQTITRVMPLMFAFFGLQFPAGLLVYWTVSNGLQIAQQTYLIRKGHIGPEAIERQIQQQRARAQDAPPKRGLMSWMTDKAQDAQSRRDDVQKQKGQKPRTSGGSQGRTSGQPKKGGSGQPKKRPQPPADPKAGRNDPERRGKRGVGPGNQLKRNPQPDPPEDDGDG